LQHKDEDVREAAIAAVVEVGGDEAARTLGLSRLAFIHHHAFFHYTRTFQRSEPPVINARAVV
jgi:hypothetical protein